MFSRILVPVDHDNANKLTDALALAAKTAIESNATVHYVGVVDSVPATFARTEGDRMLDA